MSEARYPPGSIRRRVDSDRLVFVKRWGHLSMAYFVTSLVAAASVYASAKWAPDLIPTGKRVPIVLTIGTLFLGASLSMVWNLLRWERLVVIAECLIHDRGVLGFWRHRTRLDVSRITDIRSEIVGTRGGGRHKATACALVIQYDDDLSFECLEELFMKKQLDWLADALRKRLELTNS